MKHYESLSHQRQSHPSPTTCRLDRASRIQTIQQRTVVTKRQQPHKRAQRTAQLNVMRLGLRQTLAIAVLLPDGSRSTGTATALGDANSAPPLKRRDDGETTPTPRVTNTTTHTVQEANGIHHCDIDKNTSANEAKTRTPAGHSGTNASYTTLCDHRDAHYSLRMAVSTHAWAFLKSNECGSGYLAAGGTGVGRAPRGGCSPRTRAGG